jgi:pimeloyl-ACP methyl ester carboxylesterase
MTGLTMLLAAATLAAGPSLAAERPVQIGPGDAALHGTLLRPEGAIAPAAVLFINGSGPTDRNGDDLAAGERARPTRLLAEALAARGIVSLRYDKRGSAESRGAGEAQTFDQTVDEAAAWARRLAREPGVHCVVVVGHSQGAEIAALVSRKARTCGVVEVSGVSHDLGQIIERQATMLQRPPEVLDAIRTAVRDMRSGRPVSAVPAGYDRVFGPKAEAFTRSQISADPVAEIARVKAPVLVVQGDNDLQASVQDARALASAAKVEPVIIPGATHMLKVAPPNDVQANIKTYMDPDLPLAPEVAESIAAFVLERR